MKEQSLIYYLSIILYIYAKQGYITLPFLTQIGR